MEEKKESRAVISCDFDASSLYNESLQYPETVLDRGNALPKFITDFHII